MYYINKTMQNIDARLLTLLVSQLVRKYGVTVRIRCHIQV